MKRHPLFVVLVVGLFALVASSTSAGERCGRCDPCKPKCEVTGTWVGMKLVHDMQNDSEDEFSMNVIAQIVSHDKKNGRLSIEATVNSGIVASPTPIPAPIPMGMATFYGDAYKVKCKKNCWKYTLKGYVPGLVPLESDQLPGTPVVAAGEFCLKREKGKCWIEFDESIGLLAKITQKSAEEVDEAGDIIIKPVWMLCAFGRLHKLPLLKKSEECPEPVVIGDLED